MMTKESREHKTEQLQAVMAELIDEVLESARKGEAADVVERRIFAWALEVGRQALDFFFHLQGDGDLGETFTMPDGRVLNRLEPSERIYQSVFGDFQLNRYVYGTRPGQKIEFVPLDQRLNLPQSEFSYLLQEWDQLLGVEQAFGKVVQTMRTVLRLSAIGRQSGTDESPDGGAGGGVPRPIAASRSGGGR